MGVGVGVSAFPEKSVAKVQGSTLLVLRGDEWGSNSDMPPGTDCPYPIRILAFFEMIRPYHVVIRI